MISEGINVNITLLFGLPRYREVLEAYMSGIEERLVQNKPVNTVASVASFFLSRIDVLVDPQLENLIDKGDEKAKLAKSVHGETAIASAKLAYGIYKEIINSERFKNLLKRGMQTQRLLWASTSTKNPEYSDIKYIEPLIGRDTVNTVPPETFDAYRDHGNPEIRIEQDYRKAEEVMENLVELNISIDEVTSKLEDEGVEKFIKPFDKLLNTLDGKSQLIRKECINPQFLYLGEYGKTVNERINVFNDSRFEQKLWQMDASLWKDDPKTQEQIRNSMGWLYLPDKMMESVESINEFAKNLKESGFSHVLHMGMGGSSLAPLVISQTFTKEKNMLRLTVLDTTDPEAITNIESDLPLKDTLFIVASKSGTTAEPLAFGDYFYEKVKELKGENAGENFIAITDPGTPLAKLSQNRNFRKVYLNFHDIGGRYSALSYFGLVPAALMGIDINELLFRAQLMKHACSSSKAVKDNPGMLLGIVMGELALRGRDKVTFITSVPIKTFGMWLEQLLAESTGKDGKGLIPVAGETPGDPSDYGNDRLFIYFRMKNAIDRSLEEKVSQLCDAGHPVVTIDMNDTTDIGQEFFRWEIATATAGSVMGLNPFDQPNVQESKDNTNRMLKMVYEHGRLPENTPSIDEGLIKLFDGYVADSIHESLSEFIEHFQDHDYIALLAYWPENADTQRILELIRNRLRKHTHLAVTAGYGPRYLHSTGQLHKGGPNSGLFIQLTVSDRHDISVPGQPYSFGVFKEAQAMGDMEALKKHNRRVIRIHLNDLKDALSKLEENVRMAVETPSLHKHN